MKIEVELVEMENGLPTILEYDDVLYFIEPPVEEHKPKHHKPKRNPYYFGRR